MGKQTYLVGFRAYPTHPYQFERRPRNGNGYTDLHSGVGDLPSWNQGLQTYPMGIRACRLHSGDGHADLSHGAVGSTQWRRACKSSEGGEGGGGGLRVQTYPVCFLSSYSLSQPPSLCNVVCGYVHSIRHLLDLIMMISF